jgi:pyruvate dehydrogenase E2 component (dihydrolipoamide acetyltransferase)
MPYEILMPQLGLTMEEGMVTGWLKKPGDWVEKGEPLLVVETDKVQMEVEALSSGYLENIQVEPGTAVPVGTLLAILSDHPIAGE